MAALMKMPERPLQDHLSVRKILVPIVFAETSRHIIQQAAWLARRLHAEIILLHVVKPFNYPAGIFEAGDEITAQDLTSRAVCQAQTRSGPDASTRASWSCPHTSTSQRRPGSRNRESSI